jgi:hypothetical protein
MLQTDHNTMVVLSQDECRVNSSGDSLVRIRSSLISGREIAPAFYASAT